MAQGRVELVVDRVLAAVPTRVGQEAGLVVVKERQPPERSLSIYIAQPEARAIQSALRGDVPPRPSTWDLFLSLLGALGGSLTGAVIDGVEEARHFFATLEIHQGDRRHLVSCRPSDAIALVVRAEGATLCATEEVLASAGVPVAGPAPDGVAGPAPDKEDGPAPDSEDGPAPDSEDGPTPDSEDGP